MTFRPQAQLQSAHRNPDISPWESPPTQSELVARESYEDFARNLQKEIEKDTGIRFGYVEEHEFAAVVATADDGTETPLGDERSKELWQYLVTTKKVDAKGKIQDELRRALDNGTLALPPGFEPERAQIEAVLTRLAGDFPIKDADDRRTVRTRRAIRTGPFWSKTMAATGTTSSPKPRAPSRRRASRQRAGQDRV